MSDLIETPTADGWITNAHALTLAEEEEIRSIYGKFTIGEPYRTPQRTVDQLKAAGIVGVYLVRNG